MVEGRLEGPGVPSAGQLIQKCWSTDPKVLVVTSFWRLGMVVRILFKTHVNWNSTYLRGRQEMPILSDDPKF